MRQFGRERIALLRGHMFRFRSGRSRTPKMKRRRGDECRYRNVASHAGYGRYIDWTEAHQWNICALPGWYPPP
jgi:hypothetical protein